ncbi:helix-turn-helix domain-containing protein [Pseudoalteromonas sp. S2755]|uniref:helix-turn-helix domain-containing protein n=1 Tax=Pseudoalteromonas sp. S2755 TaxID=2066523 RepID=UPI00110B4892|nr:helix-turn-helix domain-containing protein [Pseudoalteromonas sp. S2755]TMN38833.1 hypothetical protein CWC03_10825 [Pseudoalteromonas sp. S2755]
MKLLNWIVDEKHYEMLSIKLGKSVHTVRSYAYGHRRVPENVGLEITNITSGAVTQVDLDDAYIEFQNRSTQFSLCYKRGLRLFQPVCSVSTSASVSEKKAFIECIAQELGVAEGCNHPTG